MVVIVTENQSITRHMRIALMNTGGRISFTTPKAVRTGFLWELQSRPHGQ